MEKRLPQLDARLACAAALVREGQAAADIGCDHGKLTAYLAAGGRCPRVIGTDLRPAPLARARQTLERAGLAQRTELRLGDGLSVLAPGEVGTIIVAGVSAQTTIDMLAAAPWIFDPQGPRLVLVPATKHAVLRAWLAQNGFALLRDCPVQAAGRWYAVMAAEYTGRREAEPSLADCLYGKTGSEPGGAAYAALQRGRLRRCRIGLAPDSAEARRIDAFLAAEEQPAPAEKQQ